MSHTRSRAERFPRVLPVGDAAVTVEFGSTIDLALTARVRALDRSLEHEPFRGFREAVPTYRSLLVVFDPRTITGEDVASLLLERAEGAAPEEIAGRQHVIPTKYGGDDGPDLAFVAQAKGLSQAEVVALHSGREYLALMLGFTPGFAYLGSVPDALVLPRRATPRPRIAPGSVAIAAGQTAVYPSATPGGWHVLGRTSCRLFDPFGDPPALIRPGDRVRFQPVDLLPEPEPLSPPCRPRGDEACLEVLEGGLLTTVQDTGRIGYRRWGVPWAGSADTPSLAAANHLVGNAPGDGALECTVAGPAIRFLRTILFAVAGADLTPVLHRSDLGPWRVPHGTCVRARAGNVLTFAERVSGCRAYIAFAGGIDVPRVLGSRATELAGGFGGHEGRPLRTGDTLALGRSRRGEGLIPSPPPASPGAATRLRVVLGPQSDHFTREALERFQSETYCLAVTSDRTGCRLLGPPLSHEGPAEIASDGLLPGSIQVPADGQPIVMLADSPTTGGYAKIATLLAADIASLAQLLPGEGQVTFRAVDAFGPSAPGR